MSIDLGPIQRSIQQMGENIVQQLGTQIDGVQTQVGTVRKDLHLTRDQLTELKEDFEQFVAEAGRMAQVQQSQVKVVDLKAELERSFGHYSVVRRTSIGVLHAFDVGNVSDAVVTNVAEELMLQTPRYWLAPALVALAAWSHDRQDIAEKSVREAFSRDRHKTSLFFALVLRRQGRLSTSVRWLRHYVASLDPTQLTREFAVILEAGSHEAFGPEGAQLLADRLGQWTNELRSNQQTVDDQIRRWTEEVDAHRLALGGDQYPQLRALSPDWGKWKAQLEKASALSEVLTKYTTVRDLEATLPASLEDLLDDILDTLVTEYDEEELPLRREVVYHEAVIDERGDLDRARAKSDLLQRAVDTTSDVVSLQTMAAISPELLGVSGQTQRVAIGASQAEFRRAVSRYCADYRSRALQDATLRFSETHSTIAQQYQFPELDIQVSEGEESAIGKLRSTWDSLMQKRIDAAGFDANSMFLPGVIAAVIAGVAFFIHPVAGVIGLLGAIAVIWFMADQRRTAAEQEVAQLTSAREQGYEHSVQLLQEAFAELADARIAYSELDADEAPLLHLIDSWPTVSKEA